MVAQLEVIEGTVSRANGKGFVLTGREGWLNLSRYADPAPMIPAEGAKVRVSLDRAGFVRAVEALAAAPATQQPATQPETAENGFPGKERQIIRMNVLGHATALVARSGQPTAVADMLRVASELEAWVLR